MPEIRVHRAILLRHPCALLWYFCWAHDENKQGWVILPPNVLGLLSESKSTIYRWLREGKELGFFQWYKWLGNTVKIRLGGRNKVCWQSGISNWGATADEITLEQLLQKNGRRAIAIAITTQDLQQKSHYAARRQLNQLERRCFDIPTANQLLGDSPTSLNSACGGTRGLIHRGDSQLFVGKQFIPFGASQEHICEVLNSELVSCGVSRWTLRRHLDQLNVKSRQLTQAKPEYREICDGLRKGQIQQKIKSDADISTDRTERGGIIRLDEPNGCSSERREGGHKVDVTRFSRYYGAVWLYRCNLYQLAYQLTSMKRSRRLWKEELKRNPLPVAQVVENSASTFTPQTPQIDVVAAEAREGASAANENKGGKNDNCENGYQGGGQNEVVEQVSCEIPSIWEETKQKLLKQRQQMREAKWKSAETKSIEPIQQYWQQMLGR